MKYKNKERTFGNRKVLLRILHYIKPYSFFLMGTLVCAIVSVSAQLYVPILIGNAIDEMLAKGIVNYLVIYEILKKIIMVTILAALSQWLLGVCNNRIIYLVTRDIRNDAIAKIEEVPLSYLDVHSTGDLVSRIIADVEQFGDGLLMGLAQFFTGVLLIIGTLFFMLSVNRPISLVVILVTPISLVIAAFIAKKTYYNFKLQSEVRGEQTAFVNERIEGQKVVQAFGQEEKSVREFDEINQRLQKASLKAIFYSSITNPATRFVNNMVYTGVGLVGALYAVAGGITIGQLSCFLSYSNQYTKPFNEISGIITELQNAYACVVRVIELIEEPSQKPDQAGAIELLSGQVNGNVELKDVEFSYSKEMKLIEHLNLSVSPGEKVAIVGPTGCGKTTLINLLMRFYDVDSGKIAVSGRDIKNITRKSLRSSYGMVLQDTWLRSGTIYENIVFGKPDASKEEVIEAAKAAHAHSFIARMPYGYDSIITEDGGNLSLGQKQLLCIARIMLCLPPMLILDEATSSIDTRTEIMIQKSFSKMMKGRTSFIVAHRLSTIKEADIILVMKDGNVIEQGTHDNLIRNRGFYYNLFNSQFDGMDC